MQLNNLVKPIEGMTEEELKARLFDLRHRRDVVRPAAQARKQKVQKAETKKHMTAAEKILSTLSPDDLAKLMEALGQ